MSEQMLREEVGRLTYERAVIEEQSAREAAHAIRLESENATLAARLAAAERQIGEMAKITAAGEQFYDAVWGLLNDSQRRHRPPWQTTRDDLYSAANRFRVAVTGSVIGDWNVTAGARPDHRRDEGERWVVDLRDWGTWFIRTESGDVVHEGLSRAQAIQMANEHNGDQIYPPTGPRHDAAGEGGAALAPQDGGAR